MGQRDSGAQRASLLAYHASAHSRPENPQRCQSKRHSMPRSMASTMRKSQPSATIKSAAMSGGMFVYSLCVASEVVRRPIVGANAVANVADVDWHVIAQHVAI